MINMIYVSDIDKYNAIEKIVIAKQNGIYGEYQAFSIIYEIVNEIE